MTTINKSSEICTVMNTFTVAPENLEQFLALMVEFNEQFVAKRPGYISTNLHVSADRNHVVNYTQWRSREDFARLFMGEIEPEVALYFQKLRPLAQPNPRFYDQVFYSHSVDRASTNSV